MQFTGRILRTGRPMAESVVGALDETKASGIKSWKGDLIVSPTVPIVPGQLFTLELDDGRSGDIIILNVKYASPAVATYVFSGLHTLQ